MTLKLTIALSDRDQTNALKAGDVKPVDIDLEFIAVKSNIDAYRRMIRNLEFDICELAPTAYLAAREAGAPLTVMPVPLSRRFHHGEIVCRKDSGIKSPADVNARRFGVRAYTVSAGVWVRGILASEYDVDLDSITWVVEDEDHVQVPLPGNVEHVEPGDSLVAQFERGDIDIAVTGAAGIGKSGFPEGTYPLFPNAHELEKDWYERTDIYPIHGLVALKKELVEQEPWIPSSLMKAFVASKAPFLQELRAGKRDTSNLQEYAALTEIVGDDPLPFGITKNRASLQALIDYSHDQQIIKGRPEVEEILAPRQPA